MGAGGADNSACQFSKVGLRLSRRASAKKSGSLPTKIGGKVGLHSKISDVSVQNRN